MNLIPCCRAHSVSSGENVVFFSWDVKVAEFRYHQFMRKIQTVCYVSSGNGTKNYGYVADEGSKPHISDYGQAKSRKTGYDFESNSNFEFTVGSETGGKENSAVQAPKQVTNVKESTQKYLTVRTPRYLKDKTEDRAGNNVQEAKRNIDISFPLPSQAENQKSSAMRIQEKAEYIQSSIARHRTHSLNKTIRNKSPWISYAVDQIRRSRNSRSSVKDIMDEIMDRIDPGATYVILNELQRLHDWRAVVEMSRWMKNQLWHRPSERFYNMLIGFLGREGQPDMASLLFEEMLLERVSPNNYTFTALVNAYGRAKMFNEALEVFEHMKSCEDEECRPNAVTCNTLIGVLCRGKRYNKAVEIFAQMREGGHGLSKEKCSPSIVTYNTLLDAMCREGKVDEAVDVLADLMSGKLDQSVVPDTVTFNVIVDACGKAGNAVKAEQIVREMADRGLKPDKATFTALIDAYGKAGEIEKAEATFEEMLKCGVSADVLSYTTLVSSYGRNGLLEKAEEVFKQMKERGVHPNEVTYLALIDAYGKANAPRQAEALFHGMAASNQRPNVFAYGAMMAVYGKSGEYESVVRTFEHMKREGCRPNLITYSALLSACGRSENWEDALRMLYCLQQSGSEWELCMCRLVLGGPEEEEEIWENAAKMFGGMQRFPVSMRRSLYNALIDTLWRYGLKLRAAKTAAVGRMLEVYGEGMFVFAPSPAITASSSRPGSGVAGEWVVDLHDNSVGSAVAHFYAWLNDLRLAWEWHPDVPRKISIVTGWGKHASKRAGGEAPLKYEILAELQLLGAPFEESADNPGRIVASGEAVKRWLLQPGMEGRLTLTDTVNPRPSGERPYEHL